MDLCESLSTDETFVNLFIQKCVAWGVSIVPNPKAPGEIRVISASLIPREFSKDLYERIVSVNELFNRLIDGISLDLVWLTEAHREVIKCDLFTGSLVALANRVYAVKSVSDDVRLHLLRNDFLPTDGDTRILQVEINTISAGFGGVLESLSLVHASNRSQFYPDLVGELPQNTPCTEFAAAIAMALAARDALCKTVLFVVEEGERNVNDQFALENKLLANHGIFVVRKTLAQISLVGNIVEGNNNLVLEHNDGQVVVGLVYFRSGYDPKHYPTQSEWNARELIERSNAIKCPSVLTQLAGTKKVQQLWWTANLGEFGLSVEEIAEIKSVFAKQADPSIDEMTVKSAIENTDNWVLKPQREGGGNNLYGDLLVKTLTTGTPTELAQFVLMERMNPTPKPALVLEAGKKAPTIIQNGVAEVGIYSYYIPKLNINKVCGHLVRTKGKDVREGGVNAGFAALDTLLLVD